MVFVASTLDKIIENLPQVEGPKEKKLGFKQKLKWTLIILIAFFILGVMPLFGLESAALAQFEFLEMVLGASIGSIITLGIGPIVTAAIVLQLLKGSGILQIDTMTEYGKKKFQGLQKILAFGFVVIEALVFTLLGGLTPEAGVPMAVLVFQLILGGVLIIFMDEVVSKWGFGNGIGLFIVGGVSKQIFIQLLSPLTQEGDEFSIGHIFRIFQAVQEGAGSVAFESILFIAFTIVAFFAIVYVQAIKVEIPLSFGRVRGHGIRWPLNFFYTNVIPVILIAALLANFQIISQLIAPNSMWATFFQPPNLIQLIASSGFGAVLEPNILLRSISYILVFVIGATIFGIFWVQTAGLDSKSQAKQIMASGLQIPGFRKDSRVLERMLDRYIWPLTIMGSMAIGLVASIGDLFGVLGGGTGILLTVMIIYRIYEEIAKQHMMDMNPAMRKFIS